MATAQQIYDEWAKKNQKYQDYTGGTQSFQNALESGYNAKMGENKDLITQQNALQNELYQLPTNLRASYLGGPVRNPLEQEALIGQRVGNAQNAVQNVADLLSNRKVRYEDILSKAMGQWGSETEAARLSAEAQWQAYLAQQAQEEAQRERDFQAQQAALARASSGGSGGASINWPQPTIPDDIAAKAYADYVAAQGWGTVGENVSYLPKKGATSSTKASSTKKPVSYQDPFDPYGLYKKKPTSSLGISYLKQ